MPLLMTSTGKRRRWPWLILVLAGITLFALTFLLNNLSFWIKKRFQEKYE